MPHARQQIRGAAAALLAASPVRWQRVFTQREVPPRVIMPHLLVYSPIETSSAATMHSPMQLLRDMTLIVQAHIRLSLTDDEQIERDFDDVAVEIEQKLTYAALKAATQKVSKLILQSTQSDIGE